MAKAALRTNATKYGASTVSFAHSLFVISDKKTSVVPINEYSKKLRKYLWFISPTQFPTHGQ